MKSKILIAILMICAFSFSYAQIRPKPIPKGDIKIGEKSKDEGKQVNKNLIFSKKIGETALVDKIKLATDPIVKTISFKEDGSKIKTTVYMNSGMAFTLRGVGALNPGTKKESAPVPVPSNDPGFDCVESKVRVSLSDDSFMSTYNDSKNSNIYPGAVYTFENFYNGSFKEEAAKRNPIRIATTAVDVKGDIFEVVENPNRFDILNAKNKIDLRTTISKVNRGFKAKIYETDSYAEAALALGAGATGYGATVKAGLETKRSTNDRFFMIDVTQEMFSMIAEMPSTGVFVNPEDAKKNGLMFLSGITYGFRALVSLKVSLQTTEDVVKFDAMYKGFGFGAEINIENLSKNLSKNTEVKMYIVGGENTGFLSVNQNQIMSKLNEALIKLNNKTAAPLYFNFVNMNNELIKTSSATDEFTNRNCVPKPPKGMTRLYKIKVDLTGLSYKEGDKMEERIGFDVYAELKVGDKSYGVKRIMCRNKDGVRGCKSASKIYRGSYVDYNESQEWSQELNEADLKKATLTIGASYLGFYEKGLYSDKIDPNYNRSKTFKLSGVNTNVNKDGAEFNVGNLQADLRSQEVLFSTRFYINGRDVEETTIKVNPQINHRLKF